MVGLYSIRRWLDRLFNPRPRRISNLDVRSVQRPRSRKYLRPILERLENRLAPATTLSIADASVLEPGQGDATNMVFTVTRTGDLSAPLTVGYATIAGTAKAGFDFAPEVGGATFPSGSATVTISIPTYGNGVFNNPDLTFSVQLSEFGAANIFNVGSNPLPIAVGDFNGDGKPDLVVSGPSVLLNATPPGGGVATFTAAQFLSAPGGSEAFAVGDLNGDGKPDIVSAAGPVSVQLNETPTGANSLMFAPRNDFPAGSGRESVTIADLNGDGKPDLIVADGRTITVLLNETTPGATVANFSGQLAIFPSDLDFTDVTVGDINGDGKPDLVFTNINSKTVSVLMNTTPTGATVSSFGPQQKFAVGNGPSSVAVADINGDGKPDLIVANQNTNTVSVLVNTTAPGSGTAAFASQQTFLPGTQFTSVLAGDINGDGKPDVIVSGPLGNSVLVNTTPTGAIAVAFGSQQSLALPAPSGSYILSDFNGVLLSDFNGDGTPDLAAALPNNNSVAVLLNNAVTITRSTAIGTITDSDPNKVQFFNATQFNAHASNFTMTVQLPAPAILPVTIPFSLSGTAQAGVDYTGLTASPLVIPAGQRTAIITGTLPANPVGHAGTTLTVTLGTPTNAGLGGNTSDTLTISNPYTLSLSDASAIEPGPGGTANMVFTVTRNTDNGGPLTVGYTTVPGTAQPTTDFTPMSGTTTFAAGSTTATIAIPIFGNGISDNPNLSFSVKLTNVGPEYDVATGTQPRGIAVGDINGDGKPDLVVTNYQDDSVSVLLNATPPGTKTPMFEAQAVFPTGRNPGAVLIADMNGDGRPDIVVNNLADQTVSIFENATPVGATTATFAPAQTVVGGGSERLVIAADLNGDGKLDLIFPIIGAFVLNTTAVGASVVSFGPLVASLPSDFLAEAAVDINGDGKPDLIGVSYNSTKGPGVEVMFNQTPVGGAPVLFGPEIFLTAVTTLVLPEICVGDVNGDGKPDIIVPSQAATLVVLVNTTARGSSLPSFYIQSLYVGSVADSVTIADINGDGKPDVIAARGDQNSLAVFMNTSAKNATTVSFAPAQDIQASSDSYYGSLVAADINGDGSPDLIEGNLSQGSVSSVTILLDQPESATGTIVDSDPAPVATFVTAAESVTEDTGTFSFKIKLSAASKYDVSIPFTLGGTAVSGTNYTGVTASPLIIPAGQTSATITGTLIDDNTYDTTNQTLVVNLGTPTNATLGNTPAATLTINESDPPPTVTFAGGAQTVKETDGTFSETVRLSAVSNVPTTIPFSIAGTAAAGVNYSGITAGPLVIPAGQTSATISGNLIDDGLPDSVNKTITLTLGTPTNGTLGVTAATVVTIQETGAQPTASFAFANQTVSENAAPLAVIVSLSAPTTTAIAIPYTVSGSAVSGVNYAGLATSPLVIPAGQTSGTITATLIDDGKYDTVNHTIVFTLGAPTNATLGAIPAETLVIQESDPEPMVSFKSATQTVTQSAGSFALAVTLSAASNADTTIPFTVSGTAAAGTDYSGLTASPLIIPAGQTTGSITGTLLTTPPGAGKSLTVTLGMPINGVLGQATDALTIFGPAMFTIADASAAEPAPGGTAAMNFTVTRSGDLTSAVTVGYTTAPETALPGVDFSPQTGTVAFAAGSATATISVPIIGNGVYNNPSLTFGVELTSFLSPEILAVGANPKSVVVGDFNGDGKPDLAVANAGDNTVSVLLNTTPDGSNIPTFSAPLKLTGVAKPYSVVVGDFNGDGKPDLAVANYGANKVSIFLNTTPNGAAVPTFTSAQPLFIGPTPVALAAGDFNGDGKTDLVVASLTFNTIATYLSTTPKGSLTATFAVESSPGSSTRVSSVAVTDVNGDGKPDLAATYFNGRTAQVFVNRTTTGPNSVTFDPERTLTAGNGTDAIAVADMNGDGKPDLLIANRADNTVSVIFNTTAGANGSPTFAAQKTFATGKSPSALATFPGLVAGLGNVAVANTGDNTVSLLIDATAPGAATPVLVNLGTLATGAAPSAVAAVDLNDDGKADLVVANGGSGANSLSVFVNVSASATGTIIESDLPPIVSLVNASQSVDESSGKFSIAVSLSKASGSPVSVPFTLSGSAVAGVDYTGVSANPLIIAPGQLSATISGTLPTVPSSVNKRLTLTLGTPTGAVLGGVATDAVTISQPNTVTIAATNSIQPGPGGTMDVVFTLTRGGNVEFPLTVGYTTVAGTAAANTDFTPSNGAATFASGSSTTTVGVPIFGLDAPGTVDRTFSLQLTGVVSQVGGPVSFAPKTDFSVGSQPIAVAVGDLNGDGLPDLAVADAGDNTISVLLNTTAPGASVPTFAAPQVFDVGSHPAALAIGDINHDGKPDLIVADDVAPGLVSVLLNTTPAGATVPSFTSHVDFPTGLNPVAVAIGDINGDGNPDLVVADFGSNTVSVLINTTASGATTPSFASNADSNAGIAPTAIILGDFNGDGVPDVAVVGSGSNTVALLENLTTPGSTIASFAAEQDFGTGKMPVALAAADLNADGLPDLVVANAADNTVSVLINKTSPGAATFAFSAQQDFHTGNKPSALAIRDLNGDGLKDVIAANAVDGTLSVLLNTTLPGAATPAFASQQTFATGGGPASLAVGDLNGDGQPDLVVADNVVNANTISVLLNTTALLDTNSVAGVGDTIFPFTSRSQSVAVGDLNNDGKPDLVITPLAGGRSVSVYLNTTLPGSAMPTFSGPTIFATGQILTYVTLVDFNGDGKLDIFAGNQNGTLAWLANYTPNGGAVPQFQLQPTYSTGVPANRLETADINGDGKPDFIIFTGGSTEVLLNGTAPGSFIPTFENNIQTFAVPNGGVAGTVADVNGDGRADLIVTGSDATVAVLLNTTPPGSNTASFASPVKFAVGHLPQSVAVADLNGDGKPDLIVVGHNYSAPFYSESVLLNTTAPGATTPSFAAQQTLLNDFYDTRVTVSDLNGDGKPDLIIDDYRKSGEWLLLNTTMPGARTVTLRRIWLRCSRKLILPVSWRWVI